MFLLLSGLLLSTGFAQKILDARRGVSLNAGVLKRTTE